MSANYPSKLITSVLRQIPSKPETYDLPQVLHNKLERLLHSLKHSTNTLIITGAGISTASGIPDYRSPPDTKLSVGPGQYHRGAQPGSTFRPVTFASPSFTHRAITKLVEHKYLSKVVSQNVDNLHSKALTPSTHLLEPHGNVCKEYCEKCGLLHYRNFYCRERFKQKVGDHHFNGRHCRSCGGRLLDSLVFFGESYREIVSEQLKNVKADMVLAVGTSLTIPSLQRLIKRLNVETHIVNLSETFIDQKFVSNHIYAPVDEVFRHITEQLRMEVAPFSIRYMLKSRVKAENREGIQLFLTDFEGTEVDAIKSAKLRAQNLQIQSYCVKLQQNQEQSLMIELHGYHQETPVVLQQHHLSKLRNSSDAKLWLEWDPQKLSWSIS